VFFIDDLQVVRPGEIGSTGYIKEYAQRASCNIFEYQLEAQFRCSGSEGIKSEILYLFILSPLIGAIFLSSSIFEYHFLRCCSQGSFCG
jgi:hypothetical protein